MHNVSAGNIPAPTGAVSENDRLGFTFVLALAFHGLIVFGLGFDSLNVKPTQQFMEVTLSQFKNDNAPDDADFLAQHNQQGSGSLEESAQISTNRKSIYQDNVIREIQLNTPSVIKPNPQKTLKQLSTDLSATKIFKQKNQAEQKNRPYPSADKNQFLEQNMEIASLQAKLNEQKQRFAKGPKVRQITSVSAKGSRDAAYINSFREKIEYIGNKYYPQEAKIKGLEGEVQLLVAIKKDGRIHSITMLKSSKNSTLDRAALNSVRLAAPFPSFPKAISKDTDILEIIRTWQFSKEQLSTRS